MSTDYNAISTNTDGLGQGPYGFGYGYQGSLYGGDPAQSGTLNAGGAGGTLNAGGGAAMHPGARMVGGQPGFGAGGSANGKPPIGQLIGQLFGISPPTGMHPRGVQHPRPGPVRGPIAGPRPMPRHGRVGGGTGGSLQGGTGGSLNAGGAGGTVNRRGPTPNPIRQRQGTL